MKDFIVKSLAVVGGCYLIKVGGCYILDRYKDDILDYIAESLVDYIAEEGENKEQSTGKKLKNKMILAYLKKGANKE